VAPGTNKITCSDFPFITRPAEAAQLVSKIAELLDERHFTQTKAAAVLGILQPKLSKMLRGQFRGFSERRLMDCLTRLGQDVNFVVRRKAKPRGEGDPTAGGQCLPRAG
jgi:predicted XRE-type DNA-binding protein